MVEYMVGHTFRYHLASDEMWNMKRQHKWKQLESGESVLPLAHDRTIGILGLGQLGNACAEALLNLNFCVLGWSRTTKKNDHLNGNFHHYYGIDGLDNVLQKSDVLILLLPNTKETFNIINKITLSKCKRGVAIINAGRGTLIDDDALLEALDVGIVSGATLDVFKVEPLPKEHGYWNHPKVLITPHNAANTRSNTASAVVVENIRRSEYNEPLLYVVDREHGY